uniref:DNA-directed RNA polymerase n=1 Tax=viral metagenome TaxID=1070528 RepID=A0A6C0JG82_9ZZZZ
MDNSTIWKIINTYFEDNPQSLVRHHIDSYNDFFKNGIFQIFKEKNPLRINTRFDEEINDYRSQCIMYFGGKNGDKIYFGKPIIYDDNDSHFMFPNEARLRNMTYGMTVHYDIEVEFVTILQNGEQPYVPGLDETEPLDEERFENKKTKVKIGGENDDTVGGNGYESNNEENTDKMVGGAAGKKPPVRRKKKKLDDELTAAEIAFFREALEKSMITPNMQKETIVLEKIFLGKFPIMLQSNYCVLSNLPRETRYSMGECLNDVGGYFIIDGKEKTIISQEKFGSNMINIKEMKDDKYLYSAEILSVSENVSKPIRTLAVKIVAPSPSYTNGNIVVSIPNVREPVPLFILFRALGIISDKQIITMCLLDIDKYESMVDLFAPSVHDAGGILTQRTALKYIANLQKHKTIPHTMEILADYFLPHIGEMNFTQKAYFLGNMVFRLLSVHSGLESPTDRDNFKYKRIELVGSLMHDLFREYYNIQQRQIHLAFEQQITYNRGIYENNLKGLIRENYKSVFRERSLEAGFKKAFKGNWGAQTHTKRIGVVQDLNRLSHNSMMSHLRKTNLPLDASAKLVGPRVLHPTQWGFFDPIDTPDGANIGIHKHISISSYVSQGYSREPLIKWLREKVDMKLIEDCSPILLSRMTKVFVNGHWCGSITNPIETVEKIRLFRRNGLIPTYTSATFDIKLNTVMIYTDAGRICRPIFYMDNESEKFSFESEKIKKRLEEDDKFTWNQLITGFNRKKDPKFNTNIDKIVELHEVYEGIDSESNPAKLKRFLEEKAIIDYVDTNESEGALIALNSEDIEKNKTKKFTHMEIHESFIFGMMANMIIFPENNPASRNSFSCGQSKQAVSLYHTNFQVRMDKTAVVLVNGQTPLVKSRYLEYINHEGNPYGENAIVAIMCYTGYNVEDAVLINEGALKRGLFRTTYYSTYESHEEKSKTGDSTIDKIFTNIAAETNIVGTKPGYDYSKLDNYGLVKENTEINDKTVLIGLAASGSETKDVKVDMSKTTKKGQLGIVDKTFITEGEEGFRIAKIRIREERIPAMGDKMASRAGQKGTIGLIIPEADMPFTKDGVRPDIIINPHAIPTRMTIGQLVEGITGKACAMYGGSGDCTAFNNKGSKIKIFGEMLTGVGYHSSGNEILYNGMTGEQISAEIFMGPTYYMRLKHMVKDKINYRSLGPRTALTRQAVSGRANDGGLRIGEMERDSIISHGAADFLRESMMERGDKYYIAVCNNTGMMAIYNPSKNLFMSPMADGPIKFTGSLDGKEMHIENVTKFGRDFSIVAVPYSFKLLLQELQTANIQMRLITEDNIKQFESMSYSKNVEKLLHAKKFSSKEYIEKIKKQLFETANTNDVYAKPESIKTPSPDYPEGVSPAYQPPPEDYENLRNMYKKTAEQLELSPEYDPNSGTKLYSPSTPDFSPTRAERRAQGQIVYSPTSPDEPPPTDSPSTNIDFLRQQAQTFSEGETVHYSGDSKPDRLWRITAVGPTLITIKAQTHLDELYDMDRIQNVTALDIYRPGDFVNASPVGETLPMATILPNQQTINGGGYSQNPLAGTPINFAPVFKIMNGGSDFSSEGNPDVFNAGSSSSLPSPLTNGLEAIKVKQAGGDTKKEEEKEKKESSGGGLWDLGSMLIKKIGM